MRWLIPILVLVPLEVLADAKAGEKKAQLCTLCHRTGSQFGAGIPLLEGQPAKFLVAATQDFQAEKRSSPAMQPNIERLTARDIADIADYFASRPPPAGTPADPAKVTAGEARLRELECATCHQPNFSGAGESPRLAGQGSVYLAAQLDAFAGGRRKHPTARMPAASDSEGVAAYLSSLSP